MDAIAKKAAISKPMLYLYYGSKDELFAACIHREGAKFVEALTPAALQMLCTSSSAFLSAFMMAKRTTCAFRSRLLLVICSSVSPASVLACSRTACAFGEMSSSAVAR